MNRQLTKPNTTNSLSPWSVFRDDLWDIFDRFSRDLETPSTLESRFSPKIEVKDAGKSYHVNVEVPGMDEKDINVTLRDNQLVIEGEKKNERKKEDKGFFHSEFSYGSFYRAIPLGEDVDADKVEASYRNGVLTVELQKLPEKMSKNKKIEIRSGKDKAIEADTKH